MLARHALLQLLRHLLDVFNFIQQVQDMLVLNAFDPQLPKLIPFAMQQHLARKQILFHLEENGLNPVSPGVLAQIPKWIPHWYKCMPLVLINTLYSLQLVC